MTLFFLIGSDTSFSDDDADTSESDADDAGILHRSPLALGSSPVRFSS